MKEKLYVTIDIGGTFIKYALADKKGIWREKNKRPTLAREEGGQGMLRKAIEIVQSYKAKNYNIAGVAIATAGVVDPANGSISYAGESSFPGYTGIELASEIEKATGIKCAVENDVNSMALGECWLGAGRDASSAFAMAVGTGIGGAIVIDNKIFCGASFSAGEIGFIRINDGNNIFEETASTRVLVAEAATLKNMPVAEISGEDVSIGIKDGTRR